MEGGSECCDPNGSRLDSPICEALTDMNLATMPADVDFSGYYTMGIDKGVHELG